MLNNNNYYLKKIYLYGAFHEAYSAHIQGLRDHPVITVWPYIIKIVKIMIKKKYSIGLKSDNYSVYDTNSKYTWIIIVDKCYNKGTTNP